MPELTGLDDVPWATLEHAFGSAADVPAILRAVLSDAASDREDAVEELRITIWHQGTVYSATPSAVPFLAELALADDVDRETRRQLVDLLGWIAASEGRNAFGERTQVAHVRAARAALLPGLPHFVARLEEEQDANMQVALVALLAQFPERASHTVPAVRALLDDDADPRRRLFYRLALIALGEGDSFDVNELPDAYFDENDRRELASALEAREDPPETLRSALELLSGYASDL